MKKVATLKEIEEFIDTTEVVQVTPAMAERWLQKVKRRDEKQGWPKELAQMIRDGKWRYNGQSICFDTQGYLINGYNRLKAVVMAGISVPMVVVYNVPPDAIYTIDIGKSRTHSDNLSLAGCQKIYSGLVAKALKYMHVFDQGLLGDPKSEKKIIWAKTDVIPLYEKHPAMMESARFIKTNKMNTFMPKGLDVFFHYLFSRQDEFAAGEFFKRLSDGALLTPGMPIFLLRERLRENKIAKNMGRHEIAALIIKAWNLREKKDLRELRWNPESEAFPTIEK